MRDGYNLILIIVDMLFKIVYYKLVTTIIDVCGLVEIVIDVFVRQHVLLNFIINNKGTLFISKFCLSFCYYLGIKQKLFTTFYL